MVRGAVLAEDRAVRALRVVVHHRHPVRPARPGHHQPATGCGSDCGAVAGLLRADWPAPSPWARRWPELRAHHHVGVHRCGQQLRTGHPVAIATFGSPPARHWPAWWVHSSRSRSWSAWSTSPSPHGVAGSPATTTQRSGSILTLLRPCGVTHDRHARRTTRPFWHRRPGPCRDRPATTFVGVVSAETVERYVFGSSRDK